MTSISNSLACALALSLLAPSGAAVVIVVDKAGGGDFTTLQSATAAALDGDILLVRPGDYAGLAFALDVQGKALSIIGDVGGETRVTMLSIRNLPAGGTFYLRNLTFVPNALVTFVGQTLGMTDNEGAVFVEDCVVEGAAGFGNAGGATALAAYDAVRIENCAGVSFQRCSLLGGQGADTLSSPLPGGSLFVSSAGGHAARVASSKAAFYDCLLIGGHGGSDLEFDAGGSDGGDALAAIDSRVTLSGTSVTGGDGGDGCNTVQGESHCHGGDGVVMSGAAPFVEDLDVVLTGGVGGLLDDGSSATPGVDLVALSGLHFPHAGHAVGLHKSSPVRTGESATVTVTGPAGRLFGLFFSFDAGYLPKLGFHGVFQLGVPFAGPILIDVMPPGEVYSVDFIAPEIASFGLEGYRTIDQVLMNQGPDGIVASSASSHLQVDTGF